MVLMRLTLVFLICRVCGFKNSQSKLLCLSCFGPCWALLKTKTIDTGTALVDLVQPVGREGVRKGPSWICGW